MGHWPAGHKFQWAIFILYEPWDMFATVYQRKEINETGIPGSLNLAFNSILKVTEKFEEIKMNSIKEKNSCFPSVFLHHST